MRIKLQYLAHVRSGDKGNTANICVIGFTDELYALLKDQLTAETFRTFYEGVVRGKVDRYEVDKIGALNFVAHQALGGGVSRTLCLDNYGKALASALLAYELEVPERLFNHLRGLGPAAFPV